MYPKKGSYYILKTNIIYYIVKVIEVNDEKIYFKILKDYTDDGMDWTGNIENNPNNNRERELFNNEISECIALVKSL